MHAMARLPQVRLGEDQRRRNKRVLGECGSRYSGPLRVDQCEIERVPSLDSCGNSRRFEALYDHGGISYSNTVRRRVFHLELAQHLPILPRELIDFTFPLVELAEYQRIAIHY